MSAGTGTALWSPDGTAAGSPATGPDLSYYSVNSFGGYAYRPLKQGVHGGSDVYALQSALPGKLSVDGRFGPVTKLAVVAFQEANHLVEDGIAGIATQHAAGLLVVNDVAPKHGVPALLLKGHVEHESGYQLGNFTPKYTDGSRDRGPCQINSHAHTDVLDDEAFDTKFSINLMAEHTAAYHARFKSHVGEKRAWALAAGAWNAPAWAVWLAGIRDSSAAKPTAAQVATLERYMAVCAIYYL